MTLTKMGDKRPSLLRGAAPGACQTNSNTALLIVICRHVSARLPMLVALSVHRDRRQAGLGWENSFACLVGLEHLRITFARELHGDVARHLLITHDLLHHGIKG